MPNRHSVRSLLLFILLVAALAVVGCSDDEVDSITETQGIGNSVGGVYVLTEPSELPVSWVLTLPNGNAVSGMNNVEMANQPSGDFTISWPQINGWNEPQPSVVEQTLHSGSNLSFTGTYLSQPGTAVVKSSPDGLNAGWSLTGTSGIDFSVSATRDSTLTNLIPGDYLLTFVDVEEFETPNSGLISVSASSAAFLTGKYSYPDSMVVINPVIESGEAPWTFEGPSGDETTTVTGTGRTKIELTLDGEYELTWGEMPNFVTPQPQIIHVLLEEGGEESQYNITAAYVAVDGTVGITATFGSTDLVWALTGPTGTVQSGSGDATLTGMRPGNYSLIIADQDGWIPGDAVSDDLVSSDGISLTVSAEAGVTVRSQPADLMASWNLAGPGGFSLDGSGEMLVGDLATGSYTLTWDDISGWTSPPASTQTLDANTGLVFDGLFEQGSSSLHVNTQPLGDSAGWSIAGPGGYAESGSGMATLALTESGSYTITWDEVAGYMQPGMETITFSGDEVIEFKAGYQELLDLVSITAGNYFQGSLNNEGCRGGDEDRHPVTITRDFIIKSTEVTNAEYIAMAQWALDRGYATANQYGLNDNLDGSTVELLDLDDGDQEIFYVDGVLSTNAADHPVKEVSWFGAVSYCDWLSMYRGFDRAYSHVTWQCGSSHPTLTSGFRLPTEVEWEYACRGGSTNAFANDVSILFVGNRCTSVDLVDLAWHDQNSEGWSHEVGMLDPNGWGLYDMHGNVMEWCNDWLDEDYYEYVVRHGAPEDPPGPLAGDERLARGGYFFSPVQDCRNAARHGFLPSNASYDTGFRFVLSGQ